MLRKRELGYRIEYDDEREAWILLGKTTNTLYGEYPTEREAEQIKESLEAEETD